MNQLPLWSERDEDVKLDDWYIVIVGSDDEEYGYDGLTENINDAGFVDEINDN